MGSRLERATERRAAAGFRLAEGACPGVPRRPLRVCGPGRLERGYLARIDALEERDRAGGASVAALRRELELAALVERGAQRRADAQELRAREARRRARELEQRSHRLMLALGALQRENEDLRARLDAAATPRLEPARRRGWLRRLLPGR